MIRSGSEAHAGHKNARSLSRAPLPERSSGSRRSISHPHAKRPKHAPYMRISEEVNSTRLKCAPFKKAHRESVPPSVK